MLPPSGPSGHYNPTAGSAVEPVENPELFIHSLLFDVCFWLFIVFFRGFQTVQRLFSFSCLFWPEANRRPQQLCGRRQLSPQSWRYVLSWSIWTSQKALEQVGGQQVTKLICFSMCDLCYELQSCSTCSPLGEPSGRCLSPLSSAAPVEQVEPQLVSLPPTTLFWRSMPLQRVWHTNTCECAAHLSNTAQYCDLVGGVWSATQNGNTAAGCGSSRTGVSNPVKDGSKIWDRLARGDKQDIYQTV